MFTCNEVEMIISGFADCGILYAFEVQDNEFHEKNW